MPSPDRRGYSYAAYLDGAVVDIASLQHSSPRTKARRLDPLKGRRRLTLDERNPDFANSTARSLWGEPFRRAIGNSAQIYVGRETAIWEVRHACATLLLDCTDQRLFVSLTGEIDGRKSSSWTQWKMQPSRLEAVPVDDEPSVVRLLHQAYLQTSGLRRIELTQHCGEVLSLLPPESASEENRTEMEAVAATRGHRVRFLERSSLVRTEQLRSLAQRIKTMGGICAVAVFSDITTDHLEEFQSMVEVPVYHIQGNAMGEWDCLTADLEAARRSS